MEIKTISTILCILLFQTVFGQTKILVPSKGITGIPVILDSTKISDVFEIFGDVYTEEEKALAKYYRYPELGLRFRINPYDKNQIIRAISVEYPFEVQTENGIVLDKSTMKDVWKIHNSNSYFGSKTYVWHSQNGISYFIKKYAEDRGGFNPKGQICKIEVNSDDKFGISSWVNFEFNSTPTEKKLDELISILESENFDFRELNSFWEKEKKFENEYFGLEKRTVFERKIDNNIIQENTELSMVGRFLGLNTIRLDNELVYLALVDIDADTTIVERLDRVEFEKTDFTIYTYGIFCGLGGIPPDKCLDMLQLVNDRNYEELAKWLTSINPETSVYGYIGLTFLNKKGMEILPFEIEKMEQLSKSEIEVNTCRGCFFGNLEVISKLLGKKNIKKSYKAFEKSGWLR